MAFDIKGARSSGYSDDEIADFLAQERGFDIGAARASGYTGAEVIGFLGSEAPKPPLMQRLRERFYKPPSDPSPVDLTQADPAGAGAAEILAQPTAAPTAESLPLLERPATPQMLAMQPKGIGPQEMAEGSVAPWRAKQIADAAAYGNTNRSPMLKPFIDSPTGDALRTFDRKPLDNSLFGAVTETAGDAGRGLSKVLPSLAKSGYGVLQAGAEVMGADSVSSFARAAQDAGADWLVQFDNPNGDKLVTGAFQSLGTAITGGAVAGTAGAISLAVGQTAADKFNELRKGGIGLTDSLEGATVHGVAEYLGERIGMKSLARMVDGIASKAGMPPLEALKEALKQQGEEQVTLAIQSAYDKLGSGSLRGNLTLGDYLDDVVTTAQQTAVMTAAAAGGGRIARAATQGAQMLLKPGLAAPQAAPDAPAFTPMTDAANIATAPSAQPAPINLMERQRPPLAPIRVEDQPTMPMTPEEILAAPAPAPRIDVNNADAVLTQLGLGQPSAPAAPEAARFAPIAPAVVDETPSAPVAVAPEQQVAATSGEAANEPQYKTRTAAAVNARRTGGTVAEVPGGFTVVPQPTGTGTAPINVQPAGTRGTSASDVLPANSATAAQPVSPQAPVGQPVEGAGGSQPTLAAPSATQATDLEDRLINVRDGARRWFSSDAEDGGRDYAGEYQALDDNGTPEFAAAAERILSDYKAARAKSFQPTREADAASRQAAVERAGQPDTRTPPEVAFDQSPERAIQALTAAQQDAMGKELRVSRAKRTSVGSIEALAGKARAEVRSAYLKAAAPNDPNQSSRATPEAAEAPRSEAPAPARIDAAAPASVPAAGGATTAEADGVTPDFIRAPTNAEALSKKRQQNAVVKLSEQQGRPVVFKAKGPQGPGFYAKAPKPVKNEAPKPRKKVTTIRGSSVLGAISDQLGGISPTLIADLSRKVQRTRTSKKTGKVTQYMAWDNPLHSGYGMLFRERGTSDLTEIARVLEEEGFIERGLLERDYLEARAQAEQIVKNELLNGGSTLRQGDADSVEAEMQRRREIAQDDVPYALFDGLTDDELTESGYADASSEVKTASERLLADAERAGLDTEGLQEDAARITEGKPEDEYHLQLQAAIRQALQTVAQDRGDADEVDTGAARPGGEDRSQADGGQGAQSEGLTLTAPTANEVVAEQDKREKIARDEAKAKRDADAADRKAREQRDINDRARQEASADNFQLGQSAEESLSGQGSVFDVPAPKPEPAAPNPIAPKSFRKTRMVETLVFDEESGKFVKQSVDAEAALQALKADLARLNAFRKCITGG